MTKKFHQLRQGLTKTRNRQVSRKREIEVFRELFEAMDLPYYEVGEILRTMELEDDATDILRGEFPDAGFDHLAISLKKTYDIRDFLFKEKLLKTTVWKIFIKFLQTSGESVAAVVFKISRKGYWILTNRSIGTDPLVPHVVITAKGTNPPVYIVPVDQVRKL